MTEDISIISQIEGMLLPIQFRLGGKKVLFYNAISKIFKPKFYSNILIKRIRTIMGVIRFVVVEVYNIKFTKAEIERIILTLKQTVNLRIIFPKK